MKICIAILLGFIIVKANAYEVVTKNEIIIPENTSLEVKKF